MMKGKCKKCGCTQENCIQCIEKTGHPCAWVDQSETLCTACHENEYPILFKIPMVQGILENRKTQTRRMNGLDEINSDIELWKFNGIRLSIGLKNCFAVFEDTIGSLEFIKFPWGKVGDLLWVRETFAKGYLETYLYKASDDLEDDYQKWKPSIHMPKEAARIWLKITDVRVERLQDISEKDAEAEGIEFVERVYGASYTAKVKDDWYHGTAKEAFASLWKSINGEDSWKQNPWVWVIEFEKIDK